MLLKLRKDTVLTDQMILKIVELHNSKAVEYKKNADYYDGKNDIQYRVLEDPLLPNNKVSHSYATTIVDRYAGYFMGKGVSYKENDTDGASLEEINLITTYNDDYQHNMELAKQMGIFGVAYELAWNDEIGQLRYKAISPTEMAVIVDNSLNEEVIFAIHIVYNEDIFGNEPTYGITVYDGIYEREYIANETMSQLTFVDEKPHNLGICPVAVYKNNNELINDFDRVKSLIDEYDQLESDRLNDIESISNSYLAMYGVGALTGGDEYFNEDDEYDAELERDRAIQNMRQRKVLIFNDKDAKAEYLTKAPNGTDAETIAIRLVEEIHKQSGVPEDFDKAISGATSGQALKMLCMPMENRTSLKEAGFRKGIYRRLEIINNYLQLFNVSAWNAITPVFTRNIPTYDYNSADDLVKLVSANIISQETASSQIPFIEDVVQEREKIESEKEEVANDYTAFGTQVVEDEEEVVVE